MTFAEIQQYILHQAARHQAADEEWKYAEIELDTFREILRFALAEGFEAAPHVADKVLYGANYEEDDDHTTSDYMCLLLEVFDARIDGHRLPPKTAELYQFWKAEFWPSSADD